MTTSEHRRDAKRAQLRLMRFIAAMVPIAVGFLLVYVIAAALLHSAAIAAGAAAVTVYLIALLLARPRAARGLTIQAAELVGYGLLVMVVLGAFPLRFLLPALVTMPIAAVSVVLPFLEGRRLKLFLAAALLSEAVIVTAGTLAAPFFDQPPEWFQQAVIVSATLASCALTLRLLWADSERLRALLEAERRAVAARDDFLAVASHELRTPVTPLLLKLQRRAPMPIEDVDRMRSQVQRLALLVEDLLDASRVASGRLELRRTLTPLSGIVQAATTDTAELLALARCSLTVVSIGEDVQEEWDAQRLVQAVSNLLANAAKYGAGKPVELRHGAAEGKAIIEVRDEGIGVADSERERIFQRYERAVSTRNYSGFGLGLWIVRETLEAHGGQVTVRSAPGQGATFRLELPLHAPAPGAERPRP